VFKEVPPMQTPSLRSAAVAVGLVLSPGTWALAQVVQDGDVVSYTSRVSDYAPGAPDRPAVQAETVVSAGAEFLRVHFSHFNLAPGDYLTISNPKGSHLEILEGLGPHGDEGDVWSFAVPGDTAVLTLHAGPRKGSIGKGDLGYVVDKLVHGTLPLGEESDEVLSRPDDPFAAVEIQSVCGTTGYQNVACHSNVAQRPVARLLAVSSSGSRSVRCTGWMVRGRNDNTLITNNHCFSTPSAVRSIEAQFNFQTTTCTGTTNAATTSYRGNALLRTVGMPLDYTLATLMGTPEATWGELIPLGRAPRVGELIQVIQHPSGLPKKIGHWENSNQTSRCDVESLRDTQLRYSCDTLGGSSGSVVLAAGTNTAVGLHHLGGCPNAATALSSICANAGSLLTCQ
jgi:lysyl endopeptidase